MPSKAAHRRAHAPHAPLDDPSLYINRELSHLEFQRRVLEEARDETHPLLERVKFLSILGSNIDEFFMVRVAALMQQVENGVQEKGLDGRTPAETLQAIEPAVRTLLTEAYEFLQAGLIPALEHHHIRFADLSTLDPPCRAQLDAFFLAKVFPVLTPLAFDPGRPWPHISNLSLSIAVTLRDPEGIEHFARVKIPDTLPQLVSLPPDTPNHASFLWIERLVIANLHHLFPGLEIVGAHAFRITRDAEVAIKELESDDLLETIEEAALQGLNNQINYSQVTVTVNGGLTPLPVHTGGGGFGFGRAAHDAGRVLTVAAGIALIGLAALVPFALLAALGWWLGAAVRRRRRQQALDLV